MTAVLRRVVGVATAVFLVTAILVSSASASTEDIIAPSPVPPAGEPTADNGWQAGTCTTDTPICSVDTPEHFFENAAGHPQVGFTQFIVRTKAPVETPIGELKDIRVDLPAGLSVNPQATERCPNATGRADPSSCPPGSQVGESLVTVSVLGVPFAPFAPVTKVPVYDIEPDQGQPALFGLSIAGSPVFLEADVDWAGDYHEGFTIHVPELPLSGVLSGGLILKNRLVFDGRSGDGTFITTPSTCYDPEADAGKGHVYSTYLLAASIEEEEDPGYVFPEGARPPLESPLPAGVKPIDCAGVPYDPSADVDPNTSLTDSPSGTSTEVTVPHITGGEERESSNTKEAFVVFPGGLGLNPSAANGLVACTDAQFGRGTTAPVACPPASRIGTVKIQSPPLPASDGTLEGDVFVGSQLSRDPASGDEYRIFVDAESPRYGVSVRLVGHVSANPITGRLTTRFSDLPQVPFSSFTLTLDGGPRATLTSPATCGPHRSVMTMVPWSGSPPASRTGEFTLTSAPWGGPCPQTLGQRPFAPSFSARASNPRASQFTSVDIGVGRADGNQELKGVEVILPPGLTAKLAGLRYCPEAAIAAAAARSGLAELSSPSCPADSLVGGAAIASGSGAQPLRIEAGRTYLAGPYRGAPLSLAVITPATAGPFDLGTVVVRVALFVDPRTARVRAQSDPLPHVYGGALLDLRSVSVRIDRRGFSLNGTGCRAGSFDAALSGGGANPDAPASFHGVPASAPYRATGCGSLPFKPRLFLRAFGATKRAKNPKLRAVLRARRGDANIGRAAVILPPSIILDQASIGRVCTRVQFAAGDCPANSRYGFAAARSPLLDGPLKGPVYLRSSDNTLPDLVAALHGQVDIELDGRTDTAHGRIRNTFDVVPDVPVSSFVLTIRGGRHRGLLVNSKDLCRHRQFARVNLRGHNGKKMLKKRLKLRTPCRPRHRREGHRHPSGRR